MQSLLQAMPLTKQRSPGPGVMLRVMRPSGLCALCQASQRNAPSNLAWRLPPSIVAAVNPTRLSQTYVLAALYLLEDANADRRRLQLQRRIRKLFACKKGLRDLAGQQPSVRTKV